MDEVVTANHANIKAGVKLSNSAKILDAYMRASGVTDAKSISQALDIPIRTIQRLKLEIACATDGAPFEYGESANSAKHATDGAANCATGGVSPSREVSNINNNINNYPSSKQPAQDPLAGLNGATAEIVQSVQGWMNLGDDPKPAINWITTQVRTYGADVVKRAHAKLKTDLAGGALIARPLNAFHAISDRFSKEPQAVEPVKRQTRADEKIARAQEFRRLTEEYFAEGSA